MFTANPFLGHSGCTNCPCGLAALTWQCGSWNQGKIRPLIYLEDKKRKMGPWRAHTYYLQPPFSWANNHWIGGESESQIWWSRSQVQSWLTSSITVTTQVLLYIIQMYHQLQFLRFVTVCRSKLLLKLFDNWQAEENYSESVSPATRQSMKAGFCPRNRRSRVSHMRHLSICRKCTSSPWWIFHVLMALLRQD